MSKIVNGINGGQHLADAPLTTSATAELSPELLRNTIDERIVRIRPTSTPIDQLSRCAGSRSCNSMVVEYYSVDTKETQATVSRDCAGANEDDSSGKTIQLSVDSGNIFDATDTVLIRPGNSKELVGYVTDVQSNNLTIKIVSDKTDLVIPKGSKVIRMGRAASELDVQTPQFSALPQKKSNNCQIFKMQVEQSTIQKLADKEVGWTLTDQEEAAVIDLRLGMEKNFLFGCKGRIENPANGDVTLLTGGIWNQTEKEYSFNIAEASEASLIELAAKAFTGQNGSKRKILIGGSKLIEAINKIPTQHAVVGAKNFVKWGIEFREVSTNFGTLYILHSEVFDECGRELDGFILDPDYVTKYTHTPFTVEKLDLRSSGTRNTDAVVLTEASCLVLRYPNAHARIIGVD